VKDQLYYLAAPIRLDSSNALSSFQSQPDALYALQAHRGCPITLFKSEIRLTKKEHQLTLPIGHGSINGSAPNAHLEPFLNPVLPMSTSHFFGTVIEPGYQRHYIYIHPWMIKEFQCTSIEYGKRIWLHAVTFVLREAPITKLAYHVPLSNSKGHRPKPLLERVEDRTTDAAFAETIKQEPGSHHGAEPVITLYCRHAHENFHKLLLTLQAHAIAMKTARGEDPTTPLWLNTLAV
jgi:hypothetical protein